MTAFSDNDFFELILAQGEWWVAFCQVDLRVDAIL